MEIVRAEKTDIDSIARIYERVIDKEEKGTVMTGWTRHVYPVRKTAEDALRRKDLFVIRDEGHVVATAIINQIQVDVYTEAAWQYEAKDTEVMVMHCLAVDPEEKKKGYGSAFVEFYEKYAKQHGCTSLRMDTNLLNTRAQKLYDRLGFSNVGIVKCEFNGIPDVQLICLEKPLQ